MILKPTTLILGAGASHHLGYPLGFQLRDGILGRLSYTNEIIERLPGWSEPDFRSRFRNCLSRGGWGSPDAFLEKYPEFLELGKNLIAFELKQHELSELLFPPKNNGWYGYLGECLLGSSPDEFRKNRLSIVTYNYDRAIEHFVHNLVMFRYGLSSADGWQLIIDTIPIVHVHGILGEYPLVPYEKSDDVTQAVAGIKIIHEIQDKDDDFCSPEFKRANELLNQAEVIYSVGFAMAEANMRRLRFFNIDSVKKRLVKCALGDVNGRRRVDFLRHVEPYGLVSDNIISTDSSAMFNHFVGLE